MTEQEVYAVLVCGGRDYRNMRRLFETLNKIREDVYPKTLVIVTGHASGADRLAEMWAHERYVGLKVFPADWAQGKKAGPLRNQRMLDEEHPDLVVAFPGGKGTEDMKRRARKAGVNILSVLS